MSEGEHQLQRHDGRPLLSLRNVGRAFPGAKVLQEVDLDVHPGEFLAIVGPSGSGKSTLLNILGLLDTPSSGTYLLHGEDIAAVRTKQRAELRGRVFGFVFQESNMVGRDSTARNAVLGLRARGIAPKTQAQLLVPALRRFGLEHRRNTPASMLSGGERQRLAMARAVIGAPEVVLADEPTGSLDSANGQIVVDHLRELHRSGTTVILVTHDPGLAASADRIVTMQDGWIVGDTGSCEPARTAAGTDPAPAGHRPGLVRRRRHEIVDLTADALSALTLRPAKALLLVLAFLLGSGGLGAAVGLSESAAIKVSTRLDVEAHDEVKVSRKTGYSSWEAVRSDVSSVLALPGVVDAGVVADLPASEVQPSTFRPGSLPAPDAFNGAVRVADSAYLRTQGVAVRYGDTALLDQSFGRPVALIGLDAARQLGVGRPGPGVVLWLYGQPVPVVGLIEEPGRDPVLSGAVVVGVGSYPMTSKMAAQVVVRTQPGAPAAIAEALPKALDPAATDTVDVQTVADLRDLKHGINTDLGRLVAIVSVILLAIASLSAGTTMYVGVLARSAEIALRLALGMRRSTVAAMFLVEGAVVGVLGGAAGATVGIFAALAYASSEGWVPILPDYTASWGILAGLLSGILSAVYPAVIASRANPAQLIRS
ncbi:ATP-binding cassette domain-containing protein [Paenarthrobacter sp. UW852]|uniref:ABC transporter ATP-binding protein/permease n=1 Tax=Paenarthrobacter sp. UW852 TaxID=2951989 RepID=UPI00214752C7|nr:ATP-binding cassette domain-containing protein [Paenarthrobacter sp. UW852]MCR1160159.1 ATP-binding cassette domain-containing protein [Paenarthrobacter sp. UW852]